MNVRKEVCSFSNLYKATAKCRKNVLWKDSVARFYNHSLRTTLRLKKALDNDTYELCPYSIFVIFEPKRRLITSTRFRDRIFQKSLCEHYLIKTLTKYFIPNNFACQLGKGTDKARECLKKMMIENTANDYFLKCDLHDYFGSTNHAVALNILEKRITDEWAFKEVKRIVESFGPEKSIGLGSQVSQLIQLTTLDNLDHYIVDKLHIKYYIRYMDDFILIHNDKQYLRKCLKKIYFFLKEYKLELNLKKTQVSKLSKPVHFLGFSYLLHDNGKLTKKILPKSIKRRRRKLRSRLSILSSIDFENSYQCWRAFAKKSNSRGTILKMDKYKEGLLMNKEIELLRKEMGRNKAEVQFVTDKSERSHKINEAICEELELSAQIAILRKALVAMGCDLPEFIAFNELAEEKKAMFPAEDIKHDAEAD